MATPTSEAICALLRAHSSSKTPQHALEYVAELLLDAADDSASADAAAFARVLEETLNDADAFTLSNDSVAQLVQQLVALLRPSDARENDEKAQRRAAHIAALCEKYAIGKRCLVVLEEDSEWHPAVISRQIDDVNDDNTATVHRVKKERSYTAAFRVEIEFIEFGKKVVAEMADVVLDEDRADKESEDDTTGLCEMCERATDLTAHHLIPRTTHARYMKQGYTREFLNTCVLICRQCHSKIHSTEDERTLARDYNTLEKIMAHPAIVRWVNYARKQRPHVKSIRKSKHCVYNNRAPI